MANGTMKTIFYVFDNKIIAAVLLVSLTASTSFPGSLISPPPGVSEERLWHTVVTCRFDN